MSTLPVESASGAWAAYRKWASTSAFYKALIDRFTRQSLWLAIVGAVLATLGQQLTAGARTEGTLMWVYKAPGVLGAAAVALSAYLAKQAQANDNTRMWTRARTAAESLKSIIFLYRASVSPFDGPDRIAKLASRVQKVEDDFKDVLTRPRDSKPEESSPLTVDQYITERVDDQVEFYENRALVHQKKADGWGKVTGVLGAIGALLTVVTTVAAVSAWAAVIATITAAITAYLKNQQYQMLAATYQSTAIRLRLLKDEWTASHKTDQDKADRDSFIQSCEDTMANENGAWATLWSKNSGTSTS